MTAVREPHWTRTAEPPPLQAGEVHVWRVDARPRSGPEHPLTPEVSPEERARASRFHRDEDRHRSIAAHGALRRLISRYTGRPPGDIRYGKGAHGKPFLEPPTADELEFNISHSGDWALCAFVLGRRIGVDVEKERSWRDLDQIASRYFSTREISQLVAILDPSERERAFFRCWSRKEAWVKATGRGIGAPLRGFAVSVAETEPARLLAVDFSPHEAGRWHLEHLDVGPGHAAALAIEGGGPRIVLLELDPR